MKTIKANTKQGQRFINAYQRTPFYSVEDCYKNPSTAKTRAEYLIRREMNDCGGDNYRVISFNSFGFSCAWTSPAGLRVETPQSSYIVK